jgi:hypothetical protein
MKNIPDTDVDDGASGDRRLPKLKTLNNNHSFYIAFLADIEEIKR